MKITVIGTGYVGLVAAACFAKAGHRVVGLDIDSDKIRMLRQARSCFYEPGLAELLRAGLDSGCLSFTDDSAAAIRHGRVVFMAVGTPPRENGQADLSAVMQAAADIAACARSSKIVVIKSTVPVGTGLAVQQQIERLTKVKMEVVSNPEFLREGAAVEDFLHPDRVVIGCDKPRVAAVLRRLYRTLVPGEAILTLSRPAAEMVKYASNAFLATRISYINEIADICSHTGVDVGDVCEGMGRDHRIGREFLKPGIGYGGSCFPKDVQALIQVARAAGAKAEILTSVHRRNERQKSVLAEIIFARMGRNLRGKRLAMWGLAFKPQTDDVRQAPALQTARMLLRAGAHVQCYDPVAEANAKAAMGDEPRMLFADNLYEVVTRADALVICTEWQEFLKPDFALLRRHLRTPIIFDGRNMFDPACVAAEGIEYHSIGRPPRQGNGRAPRRRQEKPAPARTRAAATATSSDKGAPA
ncbi:MAG: UDP-glucose/GDP-mannose dehydrogenase family protein [Planctomycetaceae bacterium]|nr:UDP-glucose/GDP-mannose dehydrogenase family protein [Planctomycetaceae bacterium]